MPLPWLIGAAVVAGIGALASSSDDEECRKCSRREYKDGLCEKHYAKKRQKESNRATISADIYSFISKSKDMIERKYKQKIKFSGEKFEIIADDNSISQEIRNKINTLDDDNEEMKELIQQLEEAKNAV